MNTHIKPFLCGSLALALAFSAMIASAEIITEATRTFTVNVNIDDPADPPSVFLQTINDSAILSLTRVEVGLHLIGTPADNGFASDMFVSLNRDFGPTSILLNQVGVSDSNPFGFFYDGWDVTFRDGAANGDVHTFDPGSGVLTGTYEPDGRPSSFDTVRTSLLDMFNGGTGNGEWRLAVGDLSAGGQMQLVDWSLTLEGATVVPEPTSLSLLGLGALVLIRKKQRGLKKSSAVLPTASNARACRTSMCHRPQMRFNSQKPSIQSLRLREFFKKSSLSIPVVALLLLLHPFTLQAQSTNPAPNILFIILDDVGIDQLKSFNPAAPMATPVMDTLAQHGVSFNNCWMMPECSPSRACIFTGRYPLRTGVRAAILNYNLPSAQVSPYEMTTPRLLAHAGYASALIGKFHLGGPDNNPAGLGAPAALGWNYFNGCLVGGPPYIDATLGGQTTNKALYPCGFPVGQARGVCWFLGPETNIYCSDNNGAGYTGQECVQLGGIPALDENGGFATNCDDAKITPSFTVYNGYYVWPRTVNDGTNATQIVDRRYMTTAQTDDALAWIQQQSSKGTPWMCSVSYSSIHTPYQQPPTNLYPPGFEWPAGIPEGNQTSAQIKLVSDLMLYAMDQEIGRLLVGAGLASRLPSGELQYTPEDTDTMVILCGDNGTYFSSVNVPYNPFRAKASPYETGVEAPLIMAGPLVVQPGRTVTNMVNAVDLFSLFGEIAALDVRAVVPASHILDCVPTLAYLTNSTSGPSRKYNYTELGSAVPPNVHIWPSVLTIAGQKIGTDTLFDSEALALEEGAEWFGPGAPVVYDNCCEVRANVYTNLSILPTAVWAVRNDRYKLVKSQLASCDSDINPYEFYDLTPTLTNPVGLDNSSLNLLTKDQLTSDEQANLDELMAVLNGLLASEPACTGDGNLDKTVNVEDINGLVADWGLPSVFDFNNDGTTELEDLQTLLANYGDVCFQTWQGPVPISINRVGSQTMIQWPNASVPGQLESSPQVSGTTVWTPVSISSFAIGDSNTVILSPSNQMMFFRIQQ